MTTSHHDPDEGRRVLQCACCPRTRAWTGREDAIAAGWGARWEGERRGWLCPDCFVPAPPVEPGPPNLATPQNVMSAAFGARGERTKLRADLTRLLEVDPVRVRAWAADILAKAGTGKSDRAKEWRAWASQHRAELKEPQAKRPRAARRAAA